MHALFVVFFYAFQSAAGVTTAVRFPVLQKPVLGSSFVRQNVAVPYGQVPYPYNAGYNSAFNYGSNGYYNTPSLPIYPYPYQTPYNQPYKKPSLLWPLVGLGAVGLLGTAAAMGGGGSFPIGGVPSGAGPGSGLDFSGFMPGGGSSRTPIENRAQALDAVKNHPTSAQTKCRDNAPSTPHRVVFAFSGLGSYGMSEGALYGMLGNNPQNVDFHYYPWDAADSTNITDATRCAFELATKPYTTADGKTVYNSIVILGHSFGGAGAHNLAESLKALGVEVDLAIFADPRESSNTIGANAVDWGKPGNVGRCYSFYQKSSGLPGFPVNGCNNDQTGGSHLHEPAEADLKYVATKEMAQLPACKTSYQYSVYDGAAPAPGTSCSGSTGDAYTQTAETEPQAQQ